MSDYESSEEHDYPSDGVDLFEPVAKKPIVTVPLTTILSSFMDSLTGTVVKLCQDKWLSSNLSSVSNP